MQPIKYASAEAFLADRKQPRFDCLVLDVHLGGMSGIELGRRLAVEGRDAPFICITADDDPETRAGAEAAGCAAFSVRPIPEPTCSTPSAAWRSEPYRARTSTEDSHRAL